MVFFTCSGCGSSLKKNKVEQHLYRCKQAGYLTCIDCSKDFGLDEFQSHNRCISENEKYGAVKTKPTLTKGDLKQKEIMDKIESLINENQTLPRQSLLILQQLQGQSSIPYKRGKFLNFVKNALNVRNSQLAEEIWKLIFTSKELSNATINNSVEHKNKENKNSNFGKNGSNCLTTTNNNIKENSSKKRKKCEDTDPDVGLKKIKLSVPNPIDESQDENDSTVVTSSKKVSFPWKSVIKSCLRSSDEKELPLKRLKKKVWCEYLSQQSSNSGGKPPMSDGEFNCILLKKINKNPKFRLHKERVKLVT